jgi:hypothetical protein
MTACVRSRRLLRFCAALTASTGLVVGGLAGGCVAAASARTGSQPGLPVRARFDLGIHSHVTRAQAARAAASSASFTQYQANVTVGSTSYSYVMAGKNPAVKVDNAASSIKVALVPVIIKFPNGDTWDPAKTDSCDTGGSPLSRVQNSPLFTAQAWKWGAKQIGTVQVTDAYQRADFWQYANPSGINPAYGIGLSPATLKPITISVPSADEKTGTMTRPCGNGHVGEISVQWLDGYLQKTALPSLASEGINPATVPIFLLHNVVEYDKSKYDFGYHNDTNSSPPQTYVVATYANYPTTPAPDISSLSHEIGEWQNDPYTNNPTPPWGNIGQVSGCQDDLEVGDPLTGTTFTDVLGGFTYHVQELAFFSWFYRQSPSLGLNGWYSDQHTFKTPAATCGGTGGSWGTAEQVQGTGQGGQLYAVSCASAGSCSAGGYDTDSSGNDQAIVVNQANGTWGTAEEVPGTAALNTYGSAGINALSCASAGNCGAGGWYSGASGQQAFVVNENSGTWGTAEEIPGIATLNTQGQAAVTALSCASAGNCSAAGVYFGDSGQQAFVVNEINSTWGSAVEIPGTAALNSGGSADVTSLSCASAGNCSAGGFYQDSSGQQAFVADETSGTWGTAEEVPGTAGLGAGGGDETNSVSCASPGNCSAGGSYTDNSGNGQAFVVNETSSVWGTAEEVPGTAGLGGSPLEGITSVSCPSAGNCTAGGNNSGGQPFVVNEASGVWGTAEEVPGIAALNIYGPGALESLSCASPGNCSAGGSYYGSLGRQVFVVNENNGIWRNAEKVPGTATLNIGESAGINSLSCASPGNCSAGGYYTDSSQKNQAFVVNETNGP